MKYKLILGLLLLITSLDAKSQQMEVVRGDLYFTVIDFVRWFDTPDSTLQKLEKEIYTGTDEVSLLFHELKNNGLLKTPFIRLIDSNKELKTIFVTDRDFDELKRFDCWELIEEGRKVEITVHVTKLNLKPSTIIIATKPLSYQVKEGITKHN